MARRSLTAAVKRMEYVAPHNLRNADGLDTRGGWQDEAWEMYETVGELSAVCQWMGASASRVNLFAAEIDEETGRADKPTDNPDAVEIVRDIGGGVRGQSDILRQAATLLTVVGEFYVVILVNEETGEESWHLVPPGRVTRCVEGGFTVVIDGEERDVDEESESLFRVWDRDPKEPERARSSVRAALPVLREIRAMDRVIEAAARSRVSGNGLLLIPAEAQLPRRRPPRGGDAPGLPASPTPVAVEDDTTSFSKSLYETMTRANNDPESPASVTPIVIKVPGEHVNNFRHLTLDTEIEARALETRERAIKRLALSLDIPPEVLTGMGDSTHWNANLVDESALRQHIAPLVGTICEAFTEAVLHPLLGEGSERIAVGFDMSALAQKQDRSESAVEAFDRGVISSATLRRELGFGEEDAADYNSPAARRDLAERLVSKAPSLFPLLAGVLGFEVPDNAAEMIRDAGGDSNAV